MAGGRPSHGGVLPLPRARGRWCRAALSPAGYHPPLSPLEGACPSVKTRWRNARIPVSRASVSPPKRIAWVGVGGRGRVRVRVGLRVGAAQLGLVGRVHLRVVEEVLRQRRTWACTSYDIYVCMYIYIYECGAAGWVRGAAGWAHEVAGWLPRVAGWALGVAGWVDTAADRVASWVHRAAGRMQ